MLKFCKYLASVFSNYNQMFEPYSIIFFVNRRFKGNNHIGLQGCIIIGNYAWFLMIHCTYAMTTMMRKISNMPSHQPVYFFCLYTGTYRIHSNSECLFNQFEGFLL